MKKALISLVLLLGLAHAQIDRFTLQTRLGYGEMLGLTFGAGMEIYFFQTLAGRLMAGIAPLPPGGTVIDIALLLKPVLAWPGSSFALLPYFGGGFGVLAGRDFAGGLGLVAGLELLLEEIRLDGGRIAVFVEGNHLGLGTGLSSPTWHFALGVSIHYYE